MILILLIILIVIAIWATSKAYDTGYNHGKEDQRKLSNRSYFDQE